MLPSHHEKTSNPLVDYDLIIFDKKFSNPTKLFTISASKILYLISPSIVRTVSLLASAKLIFTSGYDMKVRMWDMEDGLYIASSRPLGCTIRAVAADTKLLVAGGSEVPNTEFRIWEHEGPITSLALDPTRIYSGSWDMTVRIWDRSSLECIKILRHASSDGRLSLVDVRKLLRTNRRSLRKNVSRVTDMDRNNVEPPQRMLHGFGPNLFSVDVGADRIVCGGEEGVVRIWNYLKGAGKGADGSCMRGIRLENRMRHRKLQIEMSSKGGRTDQCSVAAKKKPNACRQEWCLAQINMG
ncbi:F-box/WD-40 repeat-containing protein [Populus alba x Populus x berolinensis]|uniref:F-box/WD-40 repeat-containing protein n=1 Tax=Populus alba x Populus x berolinensis TaxID=444605 RepID=A0AAD6MJ04_9ROSI|nr:F-box/WD-40 repeat-containing protein [Populus alba x Populus x berolinensis]